MLPCFSRSALFLIAFPRRQSVKIGGEGVSQIVGGFAGGIDPTRIVGLAEAVILFCGHEDKLPFASAGDVDWRAVGGFDNLAGFVAEICERKAAHGDTLLTMTCPYIRDVS
jgi:hypothetical protein